MTTAFSLLVLLPAILGGILLVDLCWQARGWQAVGIRIIMGAGLGIGSKACLSFFWLLGFGRLGWGFFLLEAAILALLSALWLRSWRARSGGMSHVPALHLTAWRVGVALLLVLVWASALGIFTFSSFQNPNGDFDAWTMWNLKARFMFRLGSDWITTFSPQVDWMFHADYPLLLPLTNLATWSLRGQETPRAPILLAGLFLFCSAGLLTAALARRSIGGALLAGGLLLASPRYLDLAIFQVADVPLSFFLLAACVMGAEAWADPGSRRGALVLAGLALGLAAWTKNEGSLILLAGLLAGGILLLWRRGWRSFRRQDAVALVGGLGLPLAALLVFKIFIAPPGDLASGQTLTGIGQKLADPARYLTIAAAFGRYLLAPGEYLLPITPLLALYALAAGRRVLTKGDQMGLRWATLTLVVTLGGYAAVYLLTPHPLEWHLRYSADRLFMQVYPAALFVLFACLKPPESFWTRQSNSKS